MFYVIDKDALYSLVDETVAYEADAAYAEDGTPLYDSIVITEKDRHFLDRLFDDAVSRFVSREFDVCKYSPETYTDDYGEVQLSGRMRLQFFVPDFDETMEEAFKAELSRYIVLFSATSVFQQRRPALVQEYAERAQSAMDKAVTLLKSRKHPVTL